MVTRKAAAIDTKQIRKIMKTAQGPGPDPKRPRPTAIQLNAREYAYLQRVFDGYGKGLKLSTGLKMSALWVASKVEDGDLLITRGGIIERRPWKE
jgi:hypothetical protein